MTAGRQFHTQQTHYVSAELEAADFTVSGSQKLIGVIPAGSLIIGGYTQLQTAFASSSLSLPLFVIGDGTTDTQRFCVTTDIGLATAGFYSITRGQGVATVDLNITAQLSKGAMAAQPTAGKLQYALLYIPPNDNKQDRTTFN